MANDIDEPLKAMGSDWLTIATFIDDRLANAKEKSMEDQNMLLQSLSRYFALQENHETLSAVAWDLIIPLMDFWCQTETRTAAKNLFDLAVEHGAAREVLLKLMEAQNHIDSDDHNEDEQTFVQAHLLLLNAQEKILLKLSTKKALQFLSQYTKSILYALASVHSHGNASGSDELLRTFVLYSCSTGAIHGLLSNQHNSVKDKEIMDALLRSFLTYSVASTTQPSKTFMSSVKLQQVFNLPREAQRPSLDVGHNPQGQKLTSSAIVDSTEDKFLQFVLEKVLNLDNLWHCGDWAGDVTIVDPDDDNDDSDDDEMKSENIQLSPEGSLILLARAYHKSRLKDAIYPTRVSDCTSILTNICAQNLENDVLVDSALYLCISIISNLPQETELNSTDGTLQLIQSIAFISANTSNSTLRQIAFYTARQALASTINQFRLTYYEGVMQDCPYTSLQIATIGLVKDEYLQHDDFWTNEQTSTALIESILNLDAAELVDEYQDRYLLQVSALAILIAQRRPDWHQIRDLFRQWIARQTSKMDAMAHNTELVDEVTKVQLQRAKDVLG